MDDDSKHASKHYIEWLKFLNNRSSEGCAKYGLCLFIVNNCKLSYLYDSGINDKGLEDITESIYLKQVGTLIFDIDYTLTQDRVNFQDMNSGNIQKWESVKPKLVELCNYNGLNNVKKYIENLKPASIFESNINYKDAIEYYFGGNTRISKLKEMFKRCKKGEVQVLISASFLSYKTDEKKKDVLKEMLKMIGYTEGYTEGYLSKVEYYIGNQTFHFGNLKGYNKCYV